MILKIVTDGRIQQLHSIPAGGVDVDDDHGNRRVTFNPSAFLAVQDDLHAVVICGVCNADHALLWAAPPEGEELVQALTGWQRDHLCQGLR